MQNMTHNSPAVSFLSPVTELVSEAVSGIAGLFESNSAEKSKRRELKALLECEDRVLRDMGITRGDVIDALNVSMDRSSGYHLMDIRRRRRVS
ncbi:MAG: DUF1127 domain-containing protein [Rhizobiaceae bacterium]|nr:DUF1127 domain-containing protein [Rhizobiaceae bacterium]